MATVFIKQELLVQPSVESRIPSRSKKRKRGFFDKIRRKVSVESEDGLSVEKPKKSSGIPIRATISEDQNLREGVRFVPAHLCRRVQSRPESGPSISRIRIDLDTKKDPEGKKSLIESVFSIAEIKPASPFTISKDQSMAAQILLDKKNREIQELERRLFELQELEGLKSQICKAKIEIAKQKMRRQIAEKRLQDLEDEEELEEPPRWP